MIKMTCPTPGKKSFDSRREAERFMGRLWRNDRGAPYLPTRTYKCTCGKWHMTSREKRIIQ